MNVNLTMKVFKDVLQHGQPLQRSILLRTLHVTQTIGRNFNKPISGNELARVAGIPTMMRLPAVPTSDNLNASFVGIPIDNGTSYRPGTRFGPRHIRCESCRIHEVNVATGADPYNSINVADIGDVAVNLYNLPKTCDIITKSYKDIIKNGCVPLTAGGDHTITYPILRAIADKYGPVGLIHVDAHSDCDDVMNSEKIAHGTSFKRAVDENLLDCKRVVQIGLRGSGYSVDEYKFQIDQGFRVIPAHECWHKSLSPLMDEVRHQLGNGPVYISFDIDSLDPSFAPGTGTPEIGGLTSIQGLEILRGCRGLNVVGGDLVEVSPPYDPTGTTAMTAANLLFEMLCILPGVKYLK